MRRYGMDKPYEKLAELTKQDGDVTRESLHKLIHRLSIPDNAKQNLLKLTPANYIGAAANLTLQNSVCLFCTAAVDINICPLCRYEFTHGDWDKLESHWQTTHQTIIPYAEFLPTVCTRHQQSNR